ncbi:hypothetical protein CSC2_20950 [Clostridium zeae]|uniref:Uncharacterized protein n=1 Tax=Clostridium zeae TaxID=2759022 RepID=A0ABQ1E9Y9_9CLOT|nr:hypothetical protein CSC2_20950 [Clostridium zeae]
MNTQTGSKKIRYRKNPISKYKVKIKLRGQIKFRSSNYILHIIKNSSFCMIKHIAKLNKIK